MKLCVAIFCLFAIVTYVQARDCFGYKCPKETKTCVKRLYTNEDTTKLTKEIKCLDGENVLDEDKDEMPNWFGVGFQIDNSDSRTVTDCDDDEDKTPEASRRRN